MKIKTLTLLLIITSLFCYLSWGGNHHAFLFQAEADILAKLLSKPKEVLHPFVLIPFAGQLLLLISLFYKKPIWILINIGMTCLALLSVFMFAIGLMSLNYKILCTTLPFLIVVMLVIIEYRKDKNQTSSS